MSFRMEVTAPAAGIARVIAAQTRQQTAARLRAAANDAAFQADASASMDLEQRSGMRRRYPGTPHYQGSFKPEYSGASDFGSGSMVISLRSSSPIANIIEGGSRAHEIAPSRAPRLAWPNVVLQVGQSVWHPGTKPYRIMEKAMLFAVRERFPGLNARVHR